MSFNALQVSYTLLSQSAPSSQSWSSLFNSLDAVRARNKSLWQHPAQLGKLGFLTGSPLPTQENSLGVLRLSGCHWGEVMLRHSRGGQTVLFFSPVRCWNFSGNLGFHKGSPIHTWPYISAGTLGPQPRGFTVSCRVHSLHQSPSAHDPCFTILGLWGWPWRPDVAVIRGRCSDAVHFSHE